MQTKAAVSLNQDTAAGERMFAREMFRQGRHRAGTGRYFTFTLYVLLYTPGQDTPSMARTGRIFT